IRKTDERVTGHALSKRRELRLVAAVAGGARELREGDDVDVGLAGQRLQVARDRRELLHAVLLVLAGADELEVVDDDDPEAAWGLGDGPAGLRPKLHDRDARRVVDEDREPRERARGLGVADVPGAQREEIGPRVEAEEPRDDLLGVHLEREEQDARAAPRDVVRDREAETRLPDGRARRDDHEVTAGEALGVRVDLPEA